jgi:hypothetical protein
MGIQSGEPWTRPHQKEEGTRRKRGSNNAAAPALLAGRFLLHGLLSKETPRTVRSLGLVDNVTHLLRVDGAVAVEVHGLELLVEPLNLSSEKDETRKARLES